MSLINDALKRAQDAQQKSQPAAPGPEFRRAETAPVEKRRVGILAPVVIGVCVIVGVLLVLQNRQKTAARQPVAEPKPVTPVVAAPAAKPAVQEIAAPAPVVTEKPAPVPVPVVSAPAPELKLQAIFFAPGHSSAIISGKTVRVGTLLKGFRVTAISETSATLVSATQTNVMTLEQ